MRKFSAFIYFIFSVSLGFSQALFNNNGADIYVTDGGYMIVKSNNTGLYNNAIGGAGKIDNQGMIVVEGYVKNDALINGLGDTIRLTGDWINNNTYTTNASWVDMYGADQLITGSAITTFGNLNLGGAGVKKRQTINAYTWGLLQLNDAELATDIYEMQVTNSSPSAITWNNGFVSSVGAGRLSRITNSTGTFVFPTGSPSYINPPSIFRPVQITPAAASSNTYSAMVVKGDATADGYNVSAVDDKLCKVNPAFYHRLYHAAGSDPVALTMFYDPSADGTWTDEGHWKNSQWNYIGTASGGSGLGLSSVSVNGVSDFTPEPFALARKKFNLDAGPDVNLTAGQTTTFSPVIGTTDVTSLLWTPDMDLSCDNCDNPTASPKSTTRYTITVTDGGGCKLSDSLMVTVVNSDLLIPTGFSPNGDGVNDFFHVLNKNIVKLDLQVFNRWGEKVYETTDPYEDGWDGTFKGIQQEMGVFVWQCNFMLIGDTKTRTAKGNVTLVR
jgi:gliding motility-associated-like protein